MQIKEEVKIDTSFNSTYFVDVTNLNTCSAQLKQFLCLGPIANLEIDKKRGFGIFLELSYIIWRQFFQSFLLQIYYTKSYYFDMFFYCTCVIMSQVTDIGQNKHQLSFSNLEFSNKSNMNALVHNIVI